MLSEAGLSEADFAVLPQHALNRRGGGLQVRDEEKLLGQAQQHGRTEIFRQHRPGGGIRLAASQISIGRNRPWDILLPRSWWGHFAYIVNCQRVSVCNTNLLGSK